jgi:N-acetylmuramoyl-L-alanine amidase
MIMQEKTQYVHVNQYTRPGKKNYGVHGVVWHYTASPGATAQNIRDYFDGTCVRSKRYAGAHDVIDSSGVIHMIPHNEIAYHAHDNNRCMVNKLDPNANYTAIGVELCIDKNGKLEKATYQNAVEYGAELAKKYNLDPMTDFFRHYDVTRKNCPAFWVADPAGFEQFKKDVAARLKNEPVQMTEVKPKPKPKPKPAKKDDGLLRRGDKGPAVKELQEKLIKAGEKLPRYGADGDFGTETEEAVKAFQARHGLVADGIWGPKSEAMMEKVLSKKAKSKIALPSGVLRKGDRGEKVKQLQKALNQLHFNCGAVDGIYGNKTEDAVRRFQMVYLPYEVDGIYGQHTKKAMEKQL